MENSTLMNPTLIAGLKATARHAAEAGRALTNASESLTALVVALEQELAAGAPGGPKETPLYKHANGRLSEAGVAKVEADFAAGIDDHQIAADLDVHHTAILRRRRAWTARQTKNV